MNHEKEDYSVPPLPPRRTVSTTILTSRNININDARLLNSVPPPPLQWQRNDLISFTPLTTLAEATSLSKSDNESDNLINGNVNLERTRPSLLSSNFPNLFLNQTSDIQLTPSPLRHSLFGPNSSLIPTNHTPTQLLPSPLNHQFFPINSFGNASPQLFSQIPFNEQTINGQTLNRETFNGQKFNGQTLNGQTFNSQSFTNYSYSSAALTPQSAPILGSQSLTHSQSAPAQLFNNYSYSYSLPVTFRSGVGTGFVSGIGSGNGSGIGSINSGIGSGNGSGNSSTTPSPSPTNMNIEDIKKLFNNNCNEKNLKPNVKLTKKANNSDLIDLGYDTTMKSEDVLSLFDPLMAPTIVYEPKEEIIVVNDECDDNGKDNEKLSIIEEEKRFIIKSDHSSLSSSYSSMRLKIDKDIAKPFRVIPKKFRSTNEERRFAEELIHLRCQFTADDFNSNIGLVISPTLESQRDNSLSVKLVINTQFSSHPVSFTCNIDTSVEHINSHVICTLVEDASQVNINEYMLKVYGRSEYLAADSVLSNYAYIHHCHKFDRDVHLTLVSIKDVRRPFARTLSDDDNANQIAGDDLLPHSVLCRFGELTCDSLNILLETFDREIDKLRTDAKNGSNLQPQSVIQTVKAICSQLSSIESIPLIESCNNLIELCRTFGSYKKETNNIDSDTVNAAAAIVANIPDLDAKLSEILDHALLRIRDSLAQLMLQYSRAFPVEFDINCDELGIDINKDKPKRDLSPSMDTLLCYIGLCCQLPIDWTHKEYCIVLQLWHGTRKLASVQSKSIVVTKSFFNRLSFDEWIQFDTMTLYCLPRETCLQIVLMGIKNVSDSSPPPSPTPETPESIHTPLAIGMIPMFDSYQHMSQGNYLIPLMTDAAIVSIKNAQIPMSTHCYDRTLPLCQLSISEMDFMVTFPDIIWDQSPVSPSLSRHRMNSLDSATQTEIHHLLNSKDPLEPMINAEKEQLWDRRHYLMDCPNALPKVLLSAHAHSWECSSLQQMYQLAHSWAQLSPVEAMRLLLPEYPDIVIRRLSVKWLKQLTPDELYDYLPQLIESLRHESYLNSPMVLYLMESCLTSVRVCHQLYWLLKERVHDVQFAYRARFYLNALLAICGDATKKMIDRQEQLAQRLSIISEHVKSAKESQRLNVLHLELESVNDFLMEKPMVLPLGPSMEVCGIDIKLCSYFTSNTLPLRIMFKYPHTTVSTTELEAIYKVGDDLRQDALTIQLIQIMDKLWLKDGLDLRMVTFGCVATDVRKGMVEMVVNSETLRKIQLEHGLTGSFKDRPIYEWLQKHNSSPLEYHHAVDNFTHSCAGYIVVTNILGICDRHNDNIMLTTTGHLFHIDFGKFLGDSQMMGSIKRDRVPFVLTSDMAFVINDGDKPSKQFQYFIDLCCQAFNIIRKNGNFLMSLFSLMMSSGISGLNADAVKYVYRALMPGLSEAEAMAQFTRMIEESLRSKFTQLNFFMHNLAQLRFTGDHNDQQLLSFVTKKFTKEIDGRIRHLEVVECIKRYEPEKVYHYRIKVDRHHQPDSTFVYRTYRDFVELHDKLVSMFPLAKFNTLPRSSNLIRSNTRDVAQQRAVEITLFLRGMMLLAEEISHSDLVYTFFHPILRDQESTNVGSKTLVIASPSGPIGMHTEKYNNQRHESLYGPSITGQVKLSVIYKNASLILMIMHAKNLQSPRSQTPDCYVKTYLLPDPSKLTKRKTRVVNRSCHPTFMEMIIYQISHEMAQQKRLQVSIWDYDRVTENVFIGATIINLRDMNLRTETVDWYPLT